MSELINWAKVAELRDDVGAEDFDEVVDLFLLEVEETLAELGKADRSAEHDLHFLKGSALNLGFTALSELCRIGEESAAKDADYQPECDAIRTTYDASRAEFMDNMADKLAA